MMHKLIVSGAGGGKTTGIVDDIYSAYFIKKSYKKIYVITYTNYAVNQIIKSYISKYKEIPAQIEIMTVHKFCLNKIIFPYYKYIFNNKPIKHIVTFEYNRKRQWSEFNKLLSKQCIHTDNVFSMSKWLLIGKSSFNKEEKIRVANAFNFFVSDIDSIFIDEYQDLDKNFLDIILKLMGDKRIKIKIVGDPKQQIMGKNYSRWFIDEFKKISNNVEYKNECHRFGKNLVEITNLLCENKEKQFSNKDDIILKYIYFNEFKFVLNHYNGKEVLAYINRENNNFATFNEKSDKLRININGVSGYEKKYINNRLNIIISNPNLTIEEMKTKIINLFKDNWVELNNVIKAQINSSFKSKIKTAKNFVYSINKVKGLDADHCFYVIDNNLLSYLINYQKRTQESNKLYVGLTRSKKMLCLVVDDNFDQIKALETLGFKHLEND